MPVARVLVVSDLHLESRSAWSFPASFPPFDVAVFAGDIDASPREAVERLAAEPGLAGRPVILVPGNHEHWRGTMSARLAAGRAACAGTDVHLLDRDAVVLAGVRFVGATLWTDYKLFGDAAAAMAACRLGLNDHRLIRSGPPHLGQLFQPEDAAARHAGDRAFIEDALAQPFAGPTVVVTHHAPHPGSVAPRYARDPLTPGFVSDLTSVIVAGRPALWVHGHVHGAFDYRVGDTRVLCNPKGYGPRDPGLPSENPSFDARLLVELPVGGPGRDGAPAPPSPAPQTFQLMAWTAVRLHATGTLHLLGYRTDGGCGRTSSPVRAYDPATRTATTASGNTYVLVGPPGREGFADPLVRHWLRAHGLGADEVEVIGGSMA